MSLQIKGKFIRLEHGESLKILASDGTTELSLIGINSSGKVEVKGEEVSIKTDVDSAIAAEVTSRQSADAVLDGKITAETNRATSAESILSGRIAALEADPVTKTHVDTEVDRLDGRIDSVLSNIDPAALDSLSEVVSAFQSADGSLTSAINALSTSSSSAIAAEESRALAAEAGLAADIAAETAARTAALSQVATAAQAAISAEAAARVAADSAEQSAREAADTALQGEVNAVEAGLAQEVIDRAAAVSAEESARIAGDASTLSTANSYTDTEVAAVQSEVDAVEVALSNEITRATNAESALDGRLDVLEARAHHKMKFVLTSTDISNGYVTLAHEAMPSSIVAAVGRLAIHEGASDDFTVSVVSGVTRMTFVNSLVTAGQEKLSAGDVVFVKYMA